MAEFTAIPDANLEPDKPARSIDALALRDNPIAIAEGAADAPRIQTAAIEDLAVTDAKLNATVTTAGTDWVLARNAVAAAGAVGTYAWLLHASGTVSIIAGSTYAGSSLRYAGVLYSPSTNSVLWAEAFGGTPSGTWRAVGTQDTSAGNYPGTMFLRIS